jgi:CubicO group peptidase (beta-lactamase class C family)
MLDERDELGLDAPVVNYWPEFGAEGKRETRVRWPLAHQAALPGIDVPMTLEEACAWEPVIRGLEKQRPLWEPGTRQAYHALTYGFLVGEVVRGQDVGHVLRRRSRCPTQPERVDGFA